MSDTYDKKSRRTTALVMITKYSLLLAIAAASFYVVLTLRDTLLTILAFVARNDDWQATFRHEITDKFSLIALVILALGFIVSAEFSMERRVTVLGVVLAFARNLAVLALVVFTANLSVVIIGAYPPTFFRILVICLELILGICLIAFVRRKKTPKN